MNDGPASQEEHDKLHVAAEDAARAAAHRRDVSRAVRADLRNRFTYHPPKPGQPEVYEQLRSSGLDLALAIVDRTPVSREQSLALTKLEEAVFWANAAIARHG